MKMLIAVMVLMLATLSAQAQTKLTAKVIPGAHSVGLSWANGTPHGGPITSDTVYRSLIAGGAGTVVFTSTTPITSWTDNTVTAGVTYYYTVTDSCATCNPKESGKSNEAQAVVPGDQPDPPSGVIVTGVT